MIDSAKARISDACEKIVTANLGLFKEHVGPRALELINDDAMVGEIAERVYPLLPLPVRMLVKVEAFTSLLLAHREPLIRALGGSLQIQPDTTAIDTLVRVPKVGEV